MNQRNTFERTSSLMPPRVLSIACLVLGCLVGPVAAEEPSALSGRVLGTEEPVSAAEVYAYDLATYALAKVVTNPKGQFLFEALPTGLYKIIAHKDGFVPTVELLLRRREDARQFLELQLHQEKVGDVRTAESYWDVRARIPADVLRQIGHRQLSTVAGEGVQIAGATDFQARMSASAGTTDLGTGQGQGRSTEASVHAKSMIGQTRVGVEGRYSELAPTGDSALPDSDLQSMRVTLEGTAQNLSLTASTGTVGEIRDDEVLEVDLRHYQLAWSGKAAGGDSSFSAQLIDESNYLNGGLPSYLPDASRTLNIQGSHSRSLTDRTSLMAGISLRRRQGRLLNPDGTLNDDQAIGIYGVAGSQIQPRVLVEYGLYSTVREGGLSLMPTGGMVVKLGSAWQARTSISQRVQDEQDHLVRERFNTAFFDDRSSCHEVGEACYEVSFAHGLQQEENFSVGAIHREIAETLRVYFSDDFFNRLESLLLVPGDELPEVKLSMVRRISPKVLAKLESNFASGGGGIFYATDDEAYENEVRYLVTSLDTQFQSTSTGVFVAFHHLEQDLSPLAHEGAPEMEISAAPGLEVQRLQLMLTQDLSALANIAPRLALRFNMELSRGASPYTLEDDGELRKKVMGGISVSF